MIHIRLAELQKAFALATKCAEQSNIPARERAYFRALAHLIWKSAGPDADLFDLNSGGTPVERIRKGDLA